jgi:hypoxanthine phosphoribosyltransferase
MLNRQLHPTLLTWSDIECQLHRLIGILVNHYPGQLIMLFGVPRGGSVVAGLYRYHPEVIVVETLIPDQSPQAHATYVYAYHTHAGEEREANHAKLIIVDDICCTGKTIHDWGQRGYTTATLYTRAGAEHLPDFTAETVYTDRYLLFPWEKLWGVSHEDNP